MERQRSAGTELALLPAEVQITLSGLLILKKSEQACYQVMRMQRPADLAETRVFVTEAVIEGARWYRLRVGYFESVLGIAESGERMQLRTSGDAGIGGTFVALLKGFLGSGVTFAPGVFAHGGWLLSSVSIVVSGALSFFCTHLLLECRSRSWHEFEIRSHLIIE